MRKKASKMKAYGQNYYAVGFNMNIYCVDCLPYNVDVVVDNCLPILPDSEWDYVPTCCICGKEHKYMKIPDSECVKKSIPKSRIGRIYSNIIKLGNIDCLEDGYKNLSVFISIELEQKYYGLVLSMACYIIYPNQTIYQYGKNLEGVIKQFSKDKKAQRIFEIMKRWNKNDSHPACKHQRELGWEEKSLDNPHIPKDYYANIHKECPICGYKYASALRYEVLPQKVVDGILKWK